MGSGGAALALGLALVTPVALQSQIQATGTVTGQVVEAQSLRPVDGAQVFLAGLSQGTLTRATGRYVIVNVPVGTHELSVERIGLASATQQVTVTAGGTTEADFQLEQQVLGLDEIVVTGTAGQARRREVGNSIVQMNVTDVQEPLQSTYALLQGRAAGVSVISSSGIIGDNTKVRIRGNVSAALANDPLIYIDGVRVQSGPYQPMESINWGAQYGVSITPAPLDDINPDDIERIEIIKGAAATTLYGTEAAAGVIQIFTKQGRTGAPQWTASSEVGVTTPNIHGTTHTLRGTPTNSFPQWDGGACWPQCFTSRLGGSAHYLYLDHWMRDAALQQKYSMSVRGSAGDVAYFIGGSWEDDEDVFVTAGQRSMGSEATSRPPFRRPSTSISTPPGTAGTSGTSGAGTICSASAHARPTAASSGRRRRIWILWSTTRSTSPRSTASSPGGLFASSPPAISRRGSRWATTGR